MWYACREKGGIFLEADILLWIQNSLRSDFLTPLMRFVTMLGDKGWFFILTAFILLVIPKTRKIGFACALALILHLLAVNLLLKPLFFRVRPYDAIIELENLVGIQPDGSFPSGHAAASFAVSTVLLLRGKKALSIPMTVLAVAISFSRLYVGVHYPTDVLAGAAVGILFGFIAVRIADSLWEKMCSFLKKGTEKLFGKKKE
ncbi:MAG: phosphatase PAP2 family protein [Clostridia bacterium]|nr:phosphatase PAP2 family protein [Clostridia bacterium]